MILGFYYHITVYKEKEKIFLPAALGLFVDELAKSVDHLYYFAFTTQTKTVEQSYRLEEDNIKLIDMGGKPSFPYLVLFGGHVLSRYKHLSTLCDQILVRAPSPLAPHFQFQFNKNTQISYLMVGDYMEGIKHQSNSWYKQIFIDVFTTFNEYAQNKAIKVTRCLVNSAPLMSKYEKITKNIFEVRTTTLQQKDFYQREDTCLNHDCINLLFVGRIERAKGMDELLDTFLRLCKNGFPVVLHLVGSDTSEARKYYVLIKKQIKDLGQIVFHGFKSGNDLVNLYRQADIFVLPSLQEGFPRVIWEAMANSLPVVSTTVGSIPHYIKNENEALLVAPGNSSDLYDAIVRLISNNELRQNIILNAFNLVQEFTLEIQVKKIIKHLFRYSN